MRTPQSHTPREKVLVEIRQRPDAGTRPAPETSAAGAATMRVVGAAAIALAASLASTKTDGSSPTCPGARASLAFGPLATSSIRAPR